MRNNAVEPIGDKLQFFYIYFEVKAKQFRLQISCTFSGQNFKVYSEIMKGSNTWIGRIPAGQILGEVPDLSWLEQ